jgi:hypothetical protein
MAANHPPRLEIVNLDPREPDGEVCNACHQWHALRPEDDIGYMFAPGVHRGDYPYVINGFALIGACRHCQYGRSTSTAVHRLTAQEIEQVLAHLAIMEPREQIEGQVGER